MNTEALKKAQKALQIADVYLRNASMHVDDTYEHRSPTIEGLQTQYRHLVEKSEVLESESGDARTRLFRVHLVLGFRWGTETEQKDVDESRITSSNDATDFSEAGRIDAKYVAEYALLSELEQECLDEFALHNASYHVWPYWREFILSSCQRMNAPKMMLPMLQMAQNRNAAACDETDSATTGR